MLSITDGVSLARALSSTIDPRMKCLLSDRCDQLGGEITDQARFIIVQINDTADDLERELGFSVSSSPCFEWVLDHGFAYEAPIIFTDDGYAHVVILEKADGIDPELEALCQAYAEASV